jgi:hypothetical protein
VQTVEILHLHLLQLLVVVEGAVRVPVLEHLEGQVVVLVMTMAMQPQVVLPVQPDKEIEAAMALLELAMLLQVVVVVQVLLEPAATLMAQI